ncbi:hypothetical protein [Microbacterium sp. CH12i]|uniref:hypothetical protein n=1 Tax=Microbacterium sp. CH12i TaxID=1479651 RepID=UPI000690DBE3|nr:hypothetical protein [Microbacterium sp. CH12i]
MSNWPETMKVGPIGDWPGELTRQRRASNFSATFSDTLRILRREIYNIVDTKAQQDSAEVLIAIPAGAFRLDGARTRTRRPSTRASSSRSTPGTATCPIRATPSRHGRTICVPSRSRSKHSGRSIATG